MTKRTLKSTTIKSASALPCKMNKNVLADVAGMISVRCWTALEVIGEV